MSGGMVGGGGVPDDLLTVKGDTHGFSTVNARVPIGSDNDILTADSTEALGLAWKTPSASSGKWEKLDYTELTISSAGTLNTSAFTPKDFLRVYFWNPANGGTRATVLKLGTGGSISSSGYNYNRWNAGTYETGSSQSNFLLNPDTTVNSDFFSVINILNLDGKAKSIVANSTVYARPNSGTSGGGWGTTGQVNIIQMDCATHGGTDANVEQGAFIEVWGADSDT